MKSEERITIQRDWFWALAQEFELKAEEGSGTQAIQDANLAYEFTLVTATLDWVLSEDSNDD